MLIFESIPMIDTVVSNMHFGIRPLQFIYLSYMLRR